MIDHIEIYVLDLEVTYNFYQWFLEMLGYELYQNWDKGFSFKKENQYIVFVQVEQKYQAYPYHRKYIGLNHLAFSVNTQEEFDHCVQTLKDKQVQFLYQNQYIKDTEPAIYFEDPMRMKLEIVYRKHSI